MTDETRCPCGLHDRVEVSPDCPIARDARLAIALWEADPRRQALARALGVPPGQVSDDMIRRAASPPWNWRDPPLQQIPRGRRR